MTGTSLLWSLLIILAVVLIVALIIDSMSVEAVERRAETERRRINTVQRRAERKIQRLTHDAMEDMTTEAQRARHDRDVS